ncbi:MAG: hypothetical protein M0D55_20330 [Elusimicrobiota bacterium]|nr:MAG: hypothetical protein M0D55_20330 [Elusimicrobiota bacterium]
MEAAVAAAGATFDGIPLHEDPYQLSVAIGEDAAHRAGLDVSSGMLGIGGLARMLRP